MAVRRKIVFDRYIITDTGKVYSIVRGGEHKLKPRTNNFGYDRVLLTLGTNIQKEFSVHRLVAQCFCDNPEGKPQVNHKNGKKQDNRATNLEWVTQKENTDHAWSTGLAKKRGPVYTEPCYDTRCKRKANRSGLCDLHMRQSLKYLNSF